MSERTLRYCPFALLPDALDAGWVMAADLGPSHGRYACLIEWLCGCPGHLAASGALTVPVNYQNSNFQPDTVIACVQQIILGLQNELAAAQRNTANPGNQIGLIQAQIAAEEAILAKLLAGGM